MLCSPVVSHSKSLKTWFKYIILDYILPDNEASILIYLLITSVSINLTFCINSDGRGEENKAEKKN